MEENKQKEYYSHHHAWKWLICVLIVLAVFGIGFACGRPPLFLLGRYGYGYPMGPWMMYGYGYPSYSYGPQSTPPANATTTPVPYYYPMWRMMGGYYYPSQATSTQ
jgi:hypothetical protein